MFVKQVKQEEVGSLMRRTTSTSTRSPRSSSLPSHSVNVGTNVPTKHETHTDIHSFTHPLGENRKVGAVLSFTEKKTMGIIKKKKKDDDLFPLSSPPSAIISGME